MTGNPAVTASEPAPVPAARLEPDAIGVAYTVIGMALVRARHLGWPHSGRPGRRHHVRQHTDRHADCLYCV